MEDAEYAARARIRASMPGRKEKPSLLLQSRGLRVKWRLNVSPPLVIYISLPRSRARFSYAFSLLRATSSRKLKPATLRESVNVTINSLHGSGGEKVDPTTPRISFHPNRTTFRITSVVNLPRNRSRIHLPWKPSASHWILSRNPAVYKFVARNRRKIM